MKYLFCLLFFIPITVNALQIRESNQGRSIDSNISPDQNFKVEGEKPPITDYLIISQSRDTTYLDTTLSMAKDYKFNYLREDNFEYMPFQNIGQPYNKLMKRFDMQGLLPQMGATARHDNYYEISDIKDYYVPTPLTDLYFKTAINQGQQLDATFTSNLSRQFNFSIGYKGMRSAGDYVNTLTSTGNFKFTSNYFTKDKRYRMRLHTTFQDLSNQENGGLNPDALQGFINEDEELDDRGRLEPNIDDATSLLDGKRFYIDHDYEFLRSQDSVAYYSARAYNTMYYEDKFYEYKELTASTAFFGPAYVNSNLKNKTNFEHGTIEFGATLDHHLFGFIKAGIARQQYTYGYNRVVFRENETIEDRLNGTLYQFKASFGKQIGVFAFQASGGLNVAGELDGNYLNAAARVEFKDFEVAAAAAISSQAPHFNYQLHQSDYVNYNWRNQFNNIKKQQLQLQLNSEKYVDIELELTNIQDHTFFIENTVSNTDGEITGYYASPQQAADPITYLKVKAHKSLSFLTYFGSDHTFAFQAVDQSSNILNVPSFITRNSIYYKDRWFKKAMQVQTGITLKYFDSYNMDGYDPVLGDFYTQNSTELGAFPLVDLFFNAKIQQTRIFFKLENATSPIGRPDYFSAPRHPFRDLSLRFGLVWNFFL